MAVFDLEYSRILHTELSHCTISATCIASPFTAASMPYTLVYNVLQYFCIPFLFLSLLGSTCFFFSFSFSLTLFFSRSFSVHSILNKKLINGLDTLHYTRLTCTLCQKIF